VAIDGNAVHAPGVRANGPADFSGLIQRGALNLSPEGDRLYVAFGGDAASGWIVAIDTRGRKVVSAFSTTARTEETQSGMWASGGPSIDGHGFVYIATGASVLAYNQKLGVPGIFPGSEHNWGQSILRLRDDRRKGFELVGTYTPFNYGPAQASDIDLGSSGTLVIDLDREATTTPSLLFLGGAKQGNAYLLDRAHMPGSRTKRPALTDDSAKDGSLLSPENQPQFGQRGPLNVFGPYANANAMNNQARSRSTACFFRAADGRNYIFVSGSAKTGAKLETSTPPGLARLEIVAAPGRPAHLRVDQLEGTQTFHNPGSPVVTSNGGSDAIVWILDQNAPRTASMYGPNSPSPVLYAFDALTLELLWKSGNGVVHQRKVQRTDGNSWSRHSRNRPDSDIWDDACCALATPQPRA